MSSAELPIRRYRIERYLAEGGMGAIYVGKKLGAGGFEKEVVLKQLLPEFTARPEFRDLFFREAKISASLDHVNIVRTYDLVRSDDALFIVMEYVRGADLRTIAWRARLRRTPLSTAAILHIAMEILAGLAYAHSRNDRKGKPLGIIHRDVSPSNILCSGQGDVKLSDFGIAKATSFASVFYKVRGKVGYMSPEQAHNEPLDGRSDLFSLAVCLFEALTGERLYIGDLQTPADQIYSQPIPRLSEKCPGVPPALDGVMWRALSPDAGGRFQDAASLATALRQVAREHGLLYSSSDLALELSSLLGTQAENWMFEELAAATSDTERLPLGHEVRGGAPDALVGKEASAINVGGESIYRKTGEVPLLRQTPTPPPPRSLTPASYGETPLMELAADSPYAMPASFPLLPNTLAADGGGFPGVLPAMGAPPPLGVKSGGLSRVLLAAVIVGSVLAAIVVLLSRA